MFTCRDSVGVLLAFLDGEMSPEESEKFEEHLSACPPCVDFLRTYRATPGLCRSAMTKKMPAEMTNQLTDFLRARTRK